MYFDGVAFFTLCHVFNLYIKDLKLYIACELLFHKGETD